MFNIGESVKVVRCRSCDTDVSGKEECPLLGGPCQVDGLGRVGIIRGFKILAYIVDVGSDKCLPYYGGNLVKISPLELLAQQSE